MSLEYSPTHIEQHARNLALDLLRLLPGDGRYAGNIERQAVGMILTGDYGNARLLLGLEGHRGEAGDLLGDVLVLLRGARYATAARKIEDWRIEWEAR